MKTTKYLLGLFSLSSMSASAFTVDFAAFFGTTVQNPLALALSVPGGGTLPPDNVQSISVPVPGYGDVTVTANFGSTLEVNRDFTNDSAEPITAINFNDTDSVTIDFNGPVPQNVDFDYVGVSLGESLNAISSSAVIGKTSYVIAFDSANASAAAGLRSISFDAVPEPSTALLGGLSLLGLLRRRR